MQIKIMRENIFEIEHYKYGRVGGTYAVKIGSALRTWDEQIITSKAVSLLAPGEGILCAHLNDLVYSNCLLSNHLYFK